MTKKSREKKLKYLENEKSLWNEIKSIFHYFWRASSCQKLTHTWECAFKFIWTTRRNSRLDQVSYKYNRANSKWYLVRFSIDIFFFFSSLVSFAFFCLLFCFFLFKYLFWYTFDYTGGWVIKKVAPGVFRKRDYFLFWPQYFRRQELHN